VRQYAVRRFLLLVPTLFGVTLLVAALVRLLPGTVVDIIVAESGGQIDRAEVERRLGLDRSFPEFYADWVWGVVRGDFGQRFRGGGEVLDDLADRIPVTLELGIFAMLVALAIAVPVGVLAAVRQDSPVDYVARSFAVSAIALPTFWLGTLAVVFIPKLFGKSLPVFYHHFWDDPVENLKQMWVPAVILGAAISGSIMRLVRSQMLEVLRQDYIRTAWAKGLRERAVVMRHALRNALIPIVTIIGLQVPVLVGGSVVMESIFVLPGMGRLLMEALFMRDYPLVLGINLVVAAFIVVANLVVDLTYGYLDPRVRMA
jgi:peptide/nickel transport system permease protein